MPPNPSSLVLQEASCVAAQAPRSVLIGARRRATTNDAKSGERGHPWLVPSFILSCPHVPSFHL